MKKFAFWLFILITSYSFASQNTAVDQTSQSSNVRHPHEFLDSLSTQVNIGYTNIDFIDNTNNLLLAGGQRTFNFSGKGLHGALLILDEIQLHGPWWIGARAGGEFWSDLSGDFVVPSAFAGYTSRYHFQKLYGVFADATVDIELVVNTLDVYGFVGVSYDRYRLKGTNTIPSGTRVIFRDSTDWLSNPRAGAGISYTFNKYYLIGIEYTHMFRNTLSISSDGLILARDNRSHQLRPSDNTIDLTISVYMNT